MRATFSMIQSAAQGCARILQDETGIRFYRFTEKQENYYRNNNYDFFVKSLATAGVRLEFVTNSQTLSVSFACTAASSRKSAFHDIVCNGRIIDHLGGDVKSEETVFGGTYRLGEGLKTVQIYFPWSSASKLLALELDDDAEFSPVSRPNKMLIFGDSITHGYDSFYPSQCYTSILADKLNADARNKGIGGERFVPKLLDEAEVPSPSIITVAYGTNDWAGGSLEELENGIRTFYSKLSSLYPQSKIIGISPVWRSNEQEIRPAGNFLDVHEKIQRLTADLPNVIIINGYHLIPHDRSLFSDGLHPNAAGNAFYGLNLAEKILKIL